MLFLVIGDRHKRKDCINRILAEAKAVPQHIYGQDGDAQDLYHKVHLDTGLFGELEVYVIHDAAAMLSAKECADYARSDNLFIFSEESAPKKVKDLFVKVDAHIDDFGKEKAKQEVKMNIFSLADAFARRDRKQLWLLFQTASAEASPEEIHGILFWQLKNLILVKTAKGELSMNPYVLKKNQAFVQAWSLAELHDLSRRFLKIFHERDSYRSLSSDLEMVILSL